MPASATGSLIPFLAFSENECDELVFSTTGLFFIRIIEHLYLKYIAVIGLDSQELGV